MTIRNFPPSHSKTVVEQSQVTTPTRLVDNFKNFIKLSTELQVKVINIAARVELRIIEIKSNGRYKTPALLRVNQLFRAEALKVYDLLPPTFSPFPIYFNPDNDTLLWKIDISEIMLQYNTAPAFLFYRWYLINVRTDIEQWTSAGNVKSFAIKLEVDYSDESHFRSLRDADPQLMMDRVAWSLRFLTPFWRSSKTFIMVSSPFFSVESLRAVFVCKLKQDLRCWKEDPTRQFPFPVSTIYEKESTFHSRFSTANDN